MSRAFLLLLFLGVSVIAQSYGCTPSDIKMDTVVAAERVPDGLAQGRIEKVTVRQTLSKMHARCSGSRLVDRAGREIRFYRLQGCWGNPPADYAEILQRQSEELDKLKKQFTVVEIACNTSGYSPP